jgi:hypothetical protein
VLELKEDSTSPPETQEGPRYSSPVL